MIDSIAKSLWNMKFNKIRKKLDGRINSNISQNASLLDFLDESNRVVIEYFSKKIFYKI